MKNTMRGDVKCTEATRKHNLRVVKHNLRVVKHPVSPQKSKYTPKNIQ
jgi:hypothetical protein